MNDLSDPRFATAVEGLLDSYVSLGGINHIEGHNLPTQSAVRTIMRDLEAVLYPGYFEAERIGVRNVRYAIGQRCARIFQMLSQEVCKSLEHSDRCETAGDQFSSERAMLRAEEIALELLESLPAIREVLHEDADAAVAGDPAARSHVEVLLAYPSMRAIGIYRVAHLLHKKRVPLIPRMMTEWVHARTGIDIHPGARIGAGIFIDHGTGVVIGETAQIGRRCKLYQGVTLGAISVEKSEPAGWDPVKRHPTLEDDVTVYSGATILGGQTVIGAGSVIGGNVWLTRSVPAGTRVQIEPPYLIYRAKGSKPVKEPIDYVI